MTAHACAKHPAGNRTCYVIHKCRCTACRAAACAYEKERARRKVYEATTPGAITTHVPGDVVRAHLRTLMDAGMGWKRIARAAGLGTSTVYPILYGKYLDQPSHPEHRPPRVQVTRGVAEKLLAVTLDLADGIPVDPTGTARRLQALVARGWSASKLARRLGLHPANFTPVLHGRRSVTIATRDAVRALYDELWDLEPPQHTHYHRAAATGARRFAERHGWAPPMAWDDDTIDDPDAQPDLGERQRVTLLEQARDLADLGYLLPEIAYRLGKDEKALRGYLRSRDLELADRIHVDLNEMDAPRGQAITLDRRRRAA